MSETTSVVGKGSGTGMQALVIVTSLGAGLMGGVFFAFSTFVMAGLRRLPPADGLRAMQSINVTAVTPAFMTLLFGTAALCVASAIAGVVTWGWGDRRAMLVLAGAALYLLGAIVWTVAFHIPRNDALAALDPAAPSSAAQWLSYAHTWTLGNHVRTLASTAAAVCLILAVL